ncbi:MAG TPA: hypothetical protein VL181_09115, partial [Holophagaceae bacterium]|nr:hypothetical protein [Holophagaceae bacterium]
MRGLRSASLLALAGLLACGTSKPPSAAAVRADRAAWSWHRMGDYIVIDGELDHPTELRLSGPSTGVSTAADFGPVHWELRSPVKGEPVTLKDAEGHLLATWVIRGKGSDEALLIARKAAPPPPRAAARAVHPAPARPAPAPTRAAKAQPPSREALKPSPIQPVAPPPLLPALEAGTWPGAGGAFNLTRGPKSQKLILLSFDGGSSDEAADEILSTLEAH